MLILDLPDDVLEKILNNLSYDEVSHCRLVSQRFNEISKRVLNHGFLKVEKFHLHCLKSVKSQLPRRESERRIHPLARHCDILTAIETRLSLLSSTFKKFMDLKLCCFIPGKVLDEIFRVLRYITSVQTPIRTHDVLQEMRDLSSMAMEHFDEKIAPALKKKQKDTGPKINILCTSMKHLRPSHAAPLSQMYKLSRFVNELSKRYNNLMSEVNSLQIKKKEHENAGKKIAELEKLAGDNKKKIGEMQKTICEYQVTIAQQDVKLFDQDLKIEKLTKLIEEIQDVGNEGSACRNLRPGVRRGRNEVLRGRKTAVVPRTTKRKSSIQNLNDETRTSGRKKSRKTLNF